MADWILCLILPGFDDGMLPWNLVFWIFSCCYKTILCYPQYDLPLLPLIWLYVCKFVYYGIRKALKAGHMIHLELSSDMRKVFLWKLNVVILSSLQEPCSCVQGYKLCQSWLRTLLSVWDSLLCVYLLNQKDGQTYSDSSTQKQIMQQ